MSIENSVCNWSQFVRVREITTVKQDFRLPGVGTLREHHQRNKTDVHELVNWKLVPQPKVVQHSLQNSTGMIVYLYIFFLKNLIFYCFEISQHLTYRLQSQWSNGCNILSQHSPTLLVFLETCCVLLRSNYSLVHRKSSVWRRDELFYSDFSNARLSL